MSEVLNTYPTEEELVDRQNQFAAVIDVDPEQLRHLRFCSSCNGFDYQWTDITFENIADRGMQPDEGEDFVNFYTDYRQYLAESSCAPCDASGFEGGCFQFAAEDWLSLGQVVVSTEVDL